MKSAKTLAAAMLFMSSLFFTACTQNQEDYTDTKDIITRNTWTVNYLSTGVNRLPLTEDYQLKFQTDGTLHVNNSAGSITGSWKLMRNVQADVLQVTLPAAQPDILELNNSWTIESASPQSITLNAAANKMRMQKF
jgi:hypothetical protein